MACTHFVQHAGRQLLHLQEVWQLLCCGSCGCGCILAHIPQARGRARAAVPPASSVDRHVRDAMHLLRLLSCILLLPQLRLLLLQSRGLLLLLLLRGLMICVEQAVSAAAWVAQAALAARAMQPCCQRADGWLLLLLSGCIVCWQ